MQEEELDSCRAAGARGPDQRDEGAGRSRSGFSLPAIGEADKKKATPDESGVASFQNA